MAQHLRHEPRPRNCSVAGWRYTDCLFITAREASAALVLITAATEPEYEIIAFSSPPRGGYGGMHGGGEPGITRVNLSPRMRMADVIKRIESIPVFTDGQYCARSSKKAGGLILRIALNECRVPERYRTHAPFHFRMAS
jgi:hypothetical protein